MRKSLILGIIAVALIFCFSTVVFAEDVILNTTVKSVTSFTDKNGNPCVRFIITETRTLKGIQYESGTAVMAFRDMVNKVKGYKAGDSLHVVASSRMFQGRKSYTILKLIE